MTVDCRFGGPAQLPFRLVTTRSESSVPLPPLDFMRLVGTLQPTPEEMIASYREVGLACRTDIESALGSDWSWQDKRLLDFGCGAGRLLRQILDWAEVGEVYGSDLDEPMVIWARENLCPPVTGIELNGFEPPLPFEDDYFDVVTAFSVFTHLGMNWADWLLEVRRVLKPGGMLIASILDQSCAESLTDVPYEEDRVGMSIWAYANPEIPYVNVLHSHWWLREHWGRAFEILSIESGSYDEKRPEAVEIPGQGLVIARAKEGGLTANDLERENPDEARYVAAHRHQQEMFRAEAESLKSRYLDSEIRLALLEESHEEAVRANASRSLPARLRRLLNRR